MRAVWYLPLLATVLLLAACGGGGSSAALPPNRAPAQPPPATLTVDGYPAKFSEYQLPPGITPADVTLGPDGAVWFANFSDFFLSTIAAGQITGTGAIRLVPEVQVPLIDDAIGERTLTSGSAGIGAVNGKVWMFAVDPQYVREAFLVGITPSTASITSVSDTGRECCAEIVQKFALSPSGNLWNLTCPASCTILAILASSQGPSTWIGDPAETYIPNAIGFGKDGSVYVTAVYVGIVENGLLRNQGVVRKYTPDARLLAQFPLPVNSDPQGIAGGPDGNLWIAERGAGKIARMTPTGQTTEFPLPNPNAKPFQIIAANDGALWFTEQAGNALGRITTSGAITEYPIPTPGSGPFGLVSCPSACEHAHGRIWFSEHGAGKIGKLEF
jgi:streptogramin lyase